MSRVVLILGIVLLFCCWSAYTVYVDCIVQRNLYDELYDLGYGRVYWRLYEARRQEDAYYQAISFFYFIILSISIIIAVIVKLSRSITHSKNETGQDKPFALYRHFNSSGELLYVGLSINPSYRQEQHRANSSWVSEIVTFTVERFATRDEMIEAERSAIRNENPKYNRVRYST
jgi:hypothetical protein